LEVDVKSIRELLTVVDAYGQTLSEGPVYDMLIKNGATPANAKAMAQAQGETDLDDVQDTDLKSIITDLISPIEPRPTGSGVIGDYGRNDWDTKYGETHNADGTPKVVVDDGELMKDGEPLTADDIAALDADSTGPDDGTRGGQEPNRPAEVKPAEVDPNRPGGNNNPFKNTTDRYAWINAGRPDIWPPEAEPVEKPAADAETPTVAKGTGADGPAGGAKAEPAATAEPEVKVEPAAPSNGSLLGRKLDTTTPNIMKAYNDGGKQAMPTIRNMQTALSRLGFDPNGIDGKYGNGTFKAVQAFQKANGLTVDGQAGPNTMAAIKKALDDKFEKNKVTPADTADKAAAATTATTAETGSTGVQPKPNSALNASKDNNMNKNKINEASMNISMNGQNAQEISDLMRMMQLAGAKEATPVSALHKGPVDGHDDMVSLMQIANDEHEGHDDSPCGMGEEGVEEEWNNSPNEEYGDLSDAIPAGNDMHKKKKAYAATQPGDNAMAVETSIKEALWAALSEKQTTEGRGRGKKMKLKASRGNEDTKTTEGSRGKKSRGKKSRG
jgi:peptidoglycan hydrolase-like protein with peptidoglycan-binding domain